MRFSSTNCKPDLIKNLLIKKICQIYKLSMSTRNENYLLLFQKLKLLCIEKIKMLIIRLYR
jgi:hypothetical protein